MEIKVVTGSTIYESAKNIFECVDVKDVFTSYYIVVPDRFTLQAENLLFDTLKIRSTFNINVVGLSSLAGRVLINSGYEQLSSLDGVLLVQKIMLEEKDNLQYFQKSNPTLCSEIYKTIEQMKSSGIKWQDIKEKTCSKNLTKKICDLKLIYQKYEENKLGKLDSDDVIEIFAQEIEKKKLYEESIFIFAGFDSFTNINYGVISALTKSVKEIWFAVNKPLSQGNAFIYENDILNKLKEVSKQNGVSISVLSKEEKFENKGKEQLIKSLFSRNIEPIENKFAYVFSANSIKEEVEFVAKSIKYGVFNGNRFKDYAIICPNLENYKNEIEVCFNRFNLTYYLDESAKFSTTLLSRFILKCFEIVTKGFLKEDILYFLSSPLLNIENREDLIAFVNEKEISGKEKFKYYINQNLNFFDLILSIKDENSFSNYAEVIEKITNFVEENLLIYIEKEKKLGFIKEASFDEQSISIMKEISEALKNFNGEISLKDFCVILKTALDSKEVSALPSFCDQIFIGDASASYFSPVKQIFVLGANAGVLPQNSNDDGLLTDGEIEKSCFNNRLSPTIKMINKRNRFKLFSAISQAKERIVISYFAFGEDGQKQEKAFFVNNILTMFKGLKVVNINSLSMNDEKSLCMLLGTKNDAKKQIKKLFVEKNKFSQSVMAVVDYNAEKYVLNREKLDEKIAEKLFFKNGSAKVTQIEKYYDCPFKQFVDNGLKLTVKNYVDVKPNIYGTIMHDFLEKFVKMLARHNFEISEKEIFDFVERELPQLIDEEILEYLPDKELFIKKLKHNAIALCKRTIYEIKNSDFLPDEKLIEKKIDGNNLVFEDIKLVGKVDRVDVCKDMFRVIDYKTGKIASALLSSLYYGKKLQLFLYGSALKKELGLDFCGAFYFDAKVAYTKNEKTILKGVFKDSEKVILSLDKRLSDDEFKQSDIVDISKTTKGFSKTSTVNMNKLEDYALKITSLAIKQMKNGNITPCPNAESCTYCEYRGICLLSADKEVRALKNPKDFFKDKKEKEWASFHQQTNNNEF